MFGKRYIWTYKKGDLNLGPQALRFLWVIVYWLIAFCVQGWIFNTILYRKYKFPWSWNPCFGAKQLFGALRFYGFHGTLIYLLFWYLFIYFVIALIFDFLFRRTTLFGRIDDRGSHGDAHFATLDEIKQAGLINEKSEVLEKYLTAKIWCYKKLLKFYNLECIKKVTDFCNEKLKRPIEFFKKEKNRLNKGFCQIKIILKKGSFKSVDFRILYPLLSIFVCFSICLTIFNILVSWTSTLPYIDFSIPQYNRPYKPLLWLISHSKKYSYICRVIIFVCIAISCWIGIKISKALNRVFLLPAAIQNIMCCKWVCKQISKSEKALDENNAKGGGVILAYWEEDESFLVKLIKHMLFIQTKFLLRDTGPDHDHISLPTRGGKGVGPVTDTSLEWKGSMVILDIKGENWQLSSGYRSKGLGQYCFRFEPTDDADEEKIKTDIEHYIRQEDAKQGIKYTKKNFDVLCKKVEEYYVKHKNELGTARWNPLMDVHLATTNETAEIQQIATMLADPEGEGLKDYWALEGYSLLTGAITYELYLAKDQHREPSLLGVRQLLSKVNKAAFESNQKDAGGWLAGDLMSYDDKSFFGIENDPTSVHPVIKLTADTMARKADDELSGVIGTANSKLELFLDSVIGRNTTNGTFTIDNIVNSDKPVSLYLIVPPTDIPRLRPLLRLFIVLLINGLTGKMVKNPVSGKISSGHINRLLLLLDEFPQLKKMDQIQVALAQMAGYGLKAMIITQSFTQLQGEYGKEETVSANCNVTMAGAPNDENTAKILSDKTGKKTEIVGHMSESVTKGKSASESVSYSEHERPLMYPHDILQLAPAVKDAKGMITAPGKLLVFVKGYPAILCEQALFFQNKEWLERTKLLPPLLTPNIKERMYEVRFAIENWQRDIQNAHKPVEDLLDDKRNIAILKNVSDKVIRKWFSQALRRNPNATTILQSMIKSAKSTAQNINIDRKVADASKNR